MRYQLLILASFCLLKISLGDINCERFLKKTISCKGDWNALNRYCTTKFDTHDKICDRRYFYLDTRCNTDYETYDKECKYREGTERCTNMLDKIDRYCIEKYAILDMYCDRGYKKLDKHCTEGSRQLEERCRHSMAKYREYCEEKPKSHSKDEIQKLE